MALLLMWVKLISLIVLAIAWHSMAEAAPANGRNLRKLLRELHKGAAPVEQRLSRRAVKIRSKNLVAEMLVLLKAKRTVRETYWNKYKESNFADPLFFLNKESNETAREIAETAEKKYLLSAAKNRE